MRWVAVGLIPLALAGCGTKYRAQGPVMTNYERAVKFPVHRPHDGLVYAGNKPATTAPIIPVMAFGIAFDVDVTLMPREGDFDRLEFARLNLPTEQLWLALETSPSGEQSIVANVDGIDTLMPELPLQRYAVDNFTTTDLSTETQIDIELTYTNSKGSQVDAVLEGKPPIRTAKRRNARTFNHSENTLLTVMDVGAQESLFKADVTVDGKGLSLKRIGGVVPARFVQTQAQGGLAVANYSILPTTNAAGGPKYDQVRLVIPGADVSDEPVALDPDTMVKMGVAQNFSTLKGCYLTRVEEEGADIAGAMDVSWTISEGVVTAVELSSEDVSDDALSACIRTAVEGWTFDASINGSVNQPLTFVAATDEADAEVELGESEVTIAGEESEDDDTLDAVDELDLDDLDIGDDIELGEDEEVAEAAEEISKTIKRGDMVLGLTNFETVHKLTGGKEITLKWLVTQRGDRVTAVQTTPLRTLTYDYRLVSDNYLELVSIAVEQYGRGTPVTAITFNPPLPDVRWSFNGRRTSDMVIDVNGQLSHAHGTVDVFWSESGPKIKVNPLEPKWLENRVMQTSILYQADGSASVAVERIE